MSDAEVPHLGRIVGEVEGGHADERTLGLMMAGAKTPALSGAEGA